MYIWNSVHTNEKVFSVLETRVEDAELVKSSRHAAAIVHRGRILTTGVNQEKTHPIMLKLQDNPKKVYLHAEVDAIIRAINLFGNDILQDCSIYIMRKTKTGRIASSKPCAGCQKFIDSVGIQHVYYT